MCLPVTRLRCCHELNLSYARNEDSGQLPALQAVASILDNIIGKQFVVVKHNDYRLIGLLLEAKLDRRPGNYDIRILQIESKFTRVSVII